MHCAPAGSKERAIRYQSVRAGVAEGSCLPSGLRRCCGRQPGNVPGNKELVLVSKGLSCGQQAGSLNRNQPEILLALGSVYNATGKTSEAIAELQRALEIAPNSDEAYSRIGSTYLVAAGAPKAFRALRGPWKLTRTTG